jgi:hypothetical protein
MPFVKLTWSIITLPDFEERACLKKKLAYMKAGFG